MKSKLHRVIVNQIATDLNIEEKVVERVLVRFFMGIRKAVNNYVMVDMKELGQFWLSYVAIWSKIRRVKKHNRNRSRFKRTYRKKLKDKEELG